MKYEVLIIDCETTGNDPLEVIEVGAVTTGLCYDSSGMVYPDGWSVIADERFKPTTGSCLGALATHNILDSDLVDCQPSAAAKLPDADYLIGHNVDYDWQALGCPNAKRICTLALSRYLWPTLDSHKLAAICYHLFGDQARDFVRNAHSALQDVMLVGRILGEIMPLLNVDSWEALYQVSEVARVPTVMPFGKHKGEPVSSIPDDYKRWLLRQDDVDPYLVKALQA